MSAVSLPIIDLPREPAIAHSRSPFPSRTRGKFIKQFAGPHKDSGIICFRFWQLVHASGCPFKCAYCFLQTTTYFRINRSALMGQIYTDCDQMLGELKEWLSADTPRMLIIGELQDGLVFDSAYAAATGKPLTHHLIPLFAAQRRHRLIFLTKSTLIKHALKLEPTPQVVFSWSVNAEYAAKRWELGAPPPLRRLWAAQRMKERGWPTRIRLDPMIPYSNHVEHWPEGYGRIIKHVNELAPEMVTIGTLRATSLGLVGAARRNGRPTDLFFCLTEKDPSGFKYRIPFETQIDMYRFALQRLEQRRITPALCKEDVSVWQALGLSFRGCHCLLQGPTVSDELISSGSFKRIGGQLRK